MVPLTLPTKMLSHQLPSRVVDINLKIETTVQEYYKHGKKVVNCWIEFIYQKKLLDRIQFVPRHFKIFYKRV